MTDAIRIRHCRLRVVRRGGWSWGADPKLLTESVTRRLPALLAKLLAEQLAGCPPGTVIQRLTLRIPARLGDIYSLPGGDVAAAAVDASTNATLQRVRAQLAARVREAVPALEARATRAERDMNIRTASTLESPTPVIDVLHRWLDEGVLPTVLAMAQPAALAAWTDAVLVELETAARRWKVSWAVLGDAVAQLLAVRARAESTAAHRVVALVRAVEGLTAAPAAAPMPEAMQAAPAAGADSPRASRTLAELRALACMISAQRLAKPHRSEPVPSRRRERMTVDSVLPFVVLGVLARSGYLAALGAALAVIDARDEAATFGAAVVYKLSPPPRRGWDRDGATARLAAALCEGAAPDNERMARFLRGLSAVCAPLDAALWTRARAARSRSGILVDRFHATGWSAMQLVTGQPLGWFASAEDFVKLAALMPHQSWWLASAAADATLTAQLLRAGRRVVTMYPPHGAEWLAVNSSWWTNDPALRRHAARLAVVTDIALETQCEHWQEFIERRPLVVAARDLRTAAELSITLAVTTALGEIATALWGERDQTTPLLALRRLGDLGGTVQFEEGRILVRPALGRRFMDLNERGLLRDIAGVPWLPGRIIGFAGP